MLPLIAVLSLLPAAPVEAPAVHLDVPGLKAADPTQADASHVGSPGPRLALEGLAGVGSVAALVFGGGALAAAAYEYRGDAGGCETACGAILLTSALAVTVVPP